MDDIFINPTKNHYNFAWGRLGDIKTGRGSLGEFMLVSCYRLMQFSLRDILEKNLGKEKAISYFIEAGRLAGEEFTMYNTLIEDPPEVFFEKLKNIFEELMIGYMTIDKYDPNTGDLQISIQNDLDCSGTTEEFGVSCSFDEGFLTGILETYSGEEYHFEEYECWGKGYNTCRFIGRIKCSAKGLSPK